MPLRPATFNPYPAQDRRAAARERYYRALEEAKRAKEAYADAMDGEDDEDCDPKTGGGGDDKADSPPPPPVPVSKARAERRHESDSAAASGSGSSSVTATAAVSSPASDSPAEAASKFASAGGGTSAFQQWFRANMGVPSPFTTSEVPQQQPPPPAMKDSVTSVLRPHLVQEQTLFDSSDRERRRAALSVAELSSPEPALDASPSPTGESLGLFQPPEFVTVPLLKVKPTHTQQDKPPQEHRPSPRPAERPLPAPAPALAPRPQQSALAALASAAAVTLAVPVPPRPSPSVPAMPTPDVALAAPVEMPAPKPKLPSPTPQHIPIFTECAPPPHNDRSKPVDPLTEITRLASTFEQLRKAFVFPAVLDFSSAAAPNGNGKDDVKLPVCARNLPVHAYEHALQKILARLESVTAARAKGVRDARKKAVADVKGEMERVRGEVQRRARER